MAEVRQFTSFKMFENHIDLVAEDRSIEILNAQDIESIKIVGLKQVDSDWFSRNFSSSIKKIEFYKCPDLSDLSFLSEFSNLEQLIMYGNGKISRLSDLKGIGNLQALRIHDVPKINDFKEIEELRNLIDFQYFGGMWSPAKIRSFEPLMLLDNLEYLSLYQVQAVHGGIKPIADLKSLKELKLSENIFKFEEYAELAGLLPNTLCECFKGFIDYNELNKSGVENNIRIVGKRRPSLNYDNNRRKIEGYLSKFNSLVQEYRETTS